MHIKTKRMPLFLPRRFCAAVITVCSLTMFSLGHSAAGQDAQTEQLWELYQQSQFDQVVAKAPLLDERPEDPLLHLVMGRVLVDDEKFSQGVPYLERVVEFDDQNSWRTAWALNYLGRAMFALGRYPSSEEALQRAAKMRATRNVTRSSVQWLRTFGFAPMFDGWYEVKTIFFASPRNSGSWTGMSLRKSVKPPSGRSPPSSMQRSPSPSISSSGAQILRRAPPGCPRSVSPVLSTAWCMPT